MSLGVIESELGLSLGWTKHTESVSSEVFLGAMDEAQDEQEQDATIREDWSWRRFNQKTEIEWEIQSNREQDWRSMKKAQRKNGYKLLWIITNSSSLERAHDTILGNQEKWIEWIVINQMRAYN